MRVPAKVRYFYDRLWDAQGGCACSACLTSLDHRDLDEAPRLIFVSGMGMLELCETCWRDLIKLIPVVDPLLNWTQKLQDFIDARRILGKPTVRVS